MSRLANIVFTVAFLLLVMGGTALPQTLEELKAQKAQLDLEKQIVDLQKDIATTKKAIADAASPPPETAAQKAATAKAEADALKAQFDARKAASDADTAADAAAVKAMFGTVPSSSGLDGSITVKEGAGKGEGALLSAVAVDHAAKAVAAKVLAKAPTGKRIVVFAGDARPRFQNWRMFLLRQDLLKEVFELAKAREKEARENYAAWEKQAGNPKVTAGVTEAPALAVAGAGLEALKNLGSFFQSNYEIGPVTVTADDHLLVAAVTQRLVAGATPPVVIDPSRLPPSITQVEMFAILRTTLANGVDGPKKAADLEALAKAARDKAAEAGTAAPAKAQLLAMAAAFDQAAATWKAGVAAHEAMLKDLATADTAGVIWAAKIAEEKNIAEGLEKGDAALFLDVNTAVGGYYTRKNIWTFLGSMPFYTMGGAVVTYSLADGKTGAALASGMIPAHSGYAKVSDVAETPGVVRPPKPSR